MSPFSLAHSPSVCHPFAPPFSHNLAEVVKWPSREAKLHREFYQAFVIVGRERTSAFRKRYKDFNVAELLLSRHVRVVWL